MIPKHFPPEDREVLKKFLEKVKEWGPPSLESVVLFGSMVRGDFGASSDIDLLIVFDESGPSDRLPEIVKIISSLKPPREIRPVVTNLKDIGEDLIQEIAREGIVLYGKLVLSPEQMALKTYRLVSYSFKDATSAERQQVARRVYGYTTRKRIGKKEKEYHYEGLADRDDCYILGKGVVAIPDSEADEFINFLKRNSAKIEARRAYL